MTWFNRSFFLFLALIIITSTKRHLPSTTPQHHPVSIAPPLRLNQLVQSNIQVVLKSICSVFITPYLTTNGLFYLKPFLGTTIPYQVDSTLSCFGNMRLSTLMLQSHKGKQWLESAVQWTRDLVAFEMVALKMRTRSVATHSQLLSSKSLWSMKTTIKQQ